MSRRFLDEWDAIIFEHSANFKNPSLPNSRNSTCTLTSEENFDTKFPDWELINDKTFSRLQSLLEEQDRAYLDKKTIQATKRILMADKDIPIEAANSLIHTIENLIAQEKKYLNQRKSDLSLISTHPTTPKSTFSPFSVGTPIEMWDENDKEKEELYSRFKNLYDFLVFLYHQQAEKRNLLKCVSIQADLKTPKPMDLSVKDLNEIDAPRCSRYSQTNSEVKDNAIYNKAAKLEQENIALISQNSDLKENLEIMQFELKNTIKLLEKCKKFKIKTEDLMNDLDEELKSIKESLENQEVDEEEYWCGVSEIIGTAVGEFNEANEEYEEQSNYEEEIESKKDEIIRLLQEKVENLTEVSKGYKGFVDKLNEEHQLLLEKINKEVDSIEIQWELENVEEKPEIDNSKMLLKEQLEKDKEIEKLTYINNEINQRYSNIQKELEEIKNSNEDYQRKLHHKEEEYKNLSISLASIRQDLSNRIKSEEDLLTDNKLLSSQVKALRESIPEKNDKVKVHLLQCENESMSRQIAALTKSNSALQESNANLSAILSESKTKFDNFSQAQEEINNLKKKLKEKNDDNKRFQSKIKQLEEERNNMRKQIDFQKEIEEESKSSKDLALKQKTTMKRMKEKCDILENENKKLAENSNISQEQVNELKLQIAKLEKTVIGKDKVILDFDKKMSILQIDINNKLDLIEELKEKINQEDDLNNEISRLNEEINKLKANQAPLHKNPPESEDHAYFEEWLSTIR